MTITIEEFCNHMSKYLKIVRQGEDVVLCSRYGRFGVSFVSDESEIGGQTRAAFPHAMLKCKN